MSINLSARSMDDLIDEILTAEVTISVAIYRQLAALREFDERKGWHDQGATCCTAWLSWRIGLSAAAARDRLRVAHALAALPQTSAAIDALVEVADRAVFCSVARGAMSVPTSVSGFCSGGHPREISIPRLVVHVEEQAL